MKNLETKDWIEFYERINRFKKAEELSIKVALIIVPVLFFAIGFIVFFLIPEPFNNWVGYSILITGLFLFLFIVMYKKRFKQNKPHVLIGKLIEIIEIRTRYGEVSKILKIQVSKAFEVSSGGKGNKIDKLDNAIAKRLLVLKHFNVETELRTLHDETAFLCVPNGQIIGYVFEGKLTKYFI